MPFDPAPKVRVGVYQDMADAMLRGCAVTRPVIGILFDYQGGACAMGALYIGLGQASAWGENIGDDGFDFTVTSPMEAAYRDEYGRFPQGDFDSRRFTREQVAARIAAL